MPAILLATLTLEWVYPTQAQRDPLFPLEGRFALSHTAGPQILKQCSRDAPSGATAYWKPSVAEMTELEAALPDFLATLKQRGVPTPPMLRPYNRQYLGFIRNGVRFVYGNFYPHDLHDLKAESTDPVMVCDGGSVFWGMTYRLDTHEFEVPQMNGAI
ncbi:MAG: hypothetical protein JNM52_07250 [Betaproteobacteria bacterium]|nr:hypothetical protein [Betaproteobacteria bacterium]